jgi:hypothetical protein
MLAKIDEWPHIRLVCGKLNAAVGLDRGHLGRVYEVHEDRWRRRNASTFARPWILAKGTGDNSGLWLTLFSRLYVCPALDIGQGHR